MNPLTLLLTGVGLVLLAGFTTVVLARRPRLAGLGLCALVSWGLGACAAAAVLILSTGGTAGRSFLPPEPGGLWTIGLDPLSAWFLLLLCCVGIPATIYGTAFLAPERDRRPVAVSQALLTLLLAAMVIVLAARAVVLFMLAWETMALSAYLLIMYESERPSVRRAGLLYLVMTHVSALALLAMFLIWGRGGPDLTFHSLAMASPELPGAAAPILLLALFGFGGKAGMVPLQVWVPGADAAEPSHVSAVLSGVMLKMGIYGLLRVLSLVGAPPAWFGWALCGLGLVSGVLGVLWALGEQDLKRVLAYSSVENVGIILLGMGVGVLGLAYGHPTVALLGLTGALLHALNHALFKSLLFLGAGAVLRATGSRLLEELGGLGRELPWTAVAFAIGSVAIVGLPPLNGFVSEWLVFQGLLLAGASGDGLRFLIIGVAGLALIGALALACFTKLNGVVFLGHPRSAGRLRPIDPVWSMLGPMVVLAGCCALLGLAPSLAVVPARAIAISVFHTLEVTGAGFGEWDRSMMQISILGFGLIAATAAAVVFRLLHARLPRFGSTWGCGATAPAPRAQYTASSYVAPLLGAFGWSSGVRRESARGHFHTRAVDLVQDSAVLAIWHALERWSQSLRALQGGRLRWYLLSLIFTLVGLLTYLMNVRPIP